MREAKVNDDTATVVIQRCLLSGLELVSGQSVYKMLSASFRLENPFVVV